MSTYKAEQFARILNDAETAKPIEGHKNAYSPDEYAKVYQAKLLMAKMEEGEIMTARIPVGAVEYNPDGSIKRLARNREALFDISRYTSNRYMVERITAQRAKSKKLTEGTYILVMWGESVVEATTQVKDLPETVRVFRFMKKEHGGTVTQEIIDASSDEDKKDMMIGDTFTYTTWEYVDTERIPREQAYKMNRELNADAMLELIQQIEEHTTINGEQITKDSLDDIA